MGILDPDHFENLAKLISGFISFEIAKNSGDHQDINVLEGIKDQREDCVSGGAKYGMVKIKNSLRNAY
jgi:hypothetical protein